MIRGIIIRIMLIALLYTINFSCREPIHTEKSVYKYIEPQYTSIQIVPVSDTINFTLSENTYNSIKSFNMFMHKGIEYISFYDDRSQSINIYQFEEKLLVKNIQLKKWFKNKPLYKTTVFVKNFDSIFINNLNTFYLLDSRGKIKRSIGFLTQPRNSMAIFENTTPLIIKGDQVFAAVRPYVKETSFKELRNWKVLYGFNMKQDKANLYYHLPTQYQENLYGYHFLDYNFCYNNSCNFVFSFPADTLIYETNLIDYHVSYYAKSRFQKGNISPVKIDDLNGKDLGYKQYRLRDSYGAIIFDPNKKRYLRLAKQKNNVDEYNLKNSDRKESIILLNEKFGIIGESEITGDFNYNTLFFSSNGKMYARINAKDEYVLHFIRLVYKESEN